MKITFTLVDDNGRRFHGTAELSPETGRRAVAPKAVRKVGPTPLSLEGNVRAFIKRHAKGKRGAQQFTLLLAHIAKGSTSAIVPLKDVEKAWKKSAGLLGGPFQSMYGTRAKDNGWADAVGRGRYQLTGDWKGCLAADGDSD
jgi:hypothetical protein